MSRRDVTVCDGCGKEVIRYDEGGGLPEGWRKLQVNKGRAHWTFDICCAYCASKAVDRTYGDEDRAALEVVQ